MPEYPPSVEFDMPGYINQLGSDPKALGRFPITAHYNQTPVLLSEFIARNAGSIMRESVAFPRPYIVPGAIYDSLWTWDAYFTGLGLLPDATEHFAGSLLNLLDRVDEEGRAPGRIDADGTADFQHLAQPIHAQWAAATAGSTGDPDLIRSIWPTLKRIRKWQDDNCRSRRGLYSWVDGSGTGIDNDPGIYSRAGSTVGLVDVNSFHYRELLAMTELATLLHEPDVEHWRDSAEELRAAINRYMWDPATSTYCHVDLSPRTWSTFQTPTWEVQLKPQTWACLFPLWTGVALPDQADRLINEHVLNPDRFLSGYGIRSTPRDQSFYNNMPMANPSNWQGPIWGLATFLTCYGLARYGYVAEAKRIATRLVSLMSDDIRHNGTIHEYYDAETGAPLFNPGFISWNTLGSRILNDLDHGTDPTQF